MADEIDQGEKCYLKSVDQNNGEKCHLVADENDMGGKCHPVSLQGVDVAKGGKSHLVSVENEKPDLKAAIVEDLTFMVKDVNTSCDVVAVKSTTEQAVEFFKMIDITLWETYHH